MREGRRGTQDREGKRRRLIGRQNLNKITGQKEKNGIGRRESRGLEKNKRGETES